MRKYNRILAIEKQLSNISREVQEKYFPELYSLPVKINTRIQALARIFIPGIYSEPKIEFSLNYYQETSLMDIKRTLKHEYIHYQLSYEGKSYQHTIQFAKIANKMKLAECYSFEAKYIEKCKCGYSHWSNQRKDLRGRCPYCKKEIKIRKRF